MPRREFSKPVKRAALKRSGMLREAVGAMYGLSAGQRCNGRLGAGVEFDHIVADGIGGEPTLENCAAVCPTCHGIKTAKHDTPAAAKVKRQSDQHHGIRVAPPCTIQSAGFLPTAKSRKRRARAAELMPLPRPSLFRPSPSESSNAD